FELLGEGRTFARGGDSDLQTVARYDRSKIEIAVGKIIDSIAENISTQGLLVDSMIHLRGIGCGNDQETIC
ncbi:MAG: hypothetical protein RB191_21035, partial [Terriglobia bacterium]|nr:hypothetical protein [Terriglobia bacterium]